MTNLLRDGPVPSTGPSFPSSVTPSTNSAKDYEIARLKAQLEKAKKDNEDLKERLFSGSFEDGKFGNAGEDKGKGVLVRTQRDLVRL